MAVLGSMAHFGHIRIPRLILTPLVTGIALVSVALVTGVLFVRGFSDNGFRLGSQFAWRYASFVFFACLTAGPAWRLAARFLPDVAPPSGLSRQLVWGFCLSYGVYLLSVFLPDVIHPSAGATLMVVFGACVALIMALTVAPATRPAARPIVMKIRRAILVTAAAYFWLCYSIMALARISGPHRPDAFYGISLSLMVVGLLARFADRWFSEHPLAAKPEQTVSNLRQSSVPN